MSVKGFRINGVIHKYDFDALENPPIRKGSGTDSVYVVSNDNSNFATGDHSFVAGNGATASGNLSVAFGTSIASGMASFAAGLKSASHPDHTTASGQTSFAFGNSALATATNAVSIGTGTVASAKTAMAFGNRTVASGNASFSMGQDNESSGVMSVTFGDHTLATGRDSFVIGSYNIADANDVDTSHGSGARKYLFTIGNGIADNSRSNALTVDWNGNLEVAGDIKSASGSIEDAYMTASASGNMVSFVNGAEGVRVKDLVIDINAVQDLHGYDNPWPGGGGKNYLIPDPKSYTSNSVTTTINADGTFSLSGTATGGDASANNVNGITFTSDTQMKFSCAGGTSNVYGYIWDATASARAKKWDGTSNVDNSYSSTYNELLCLANHTYKFYITVKSGTNATGMILKPMIVAASETNTDYAPYSNICPITGWTEAKVVDDPAYGGFINWNQLAKALNSSNWAANSGSATFTDGVAKYTITEVNSAAYGNRLWTAGYVSGLANHKYYAACTHRESKVGLRFFFTYVASSVGVTVDSSTSWVRSENISTISSGDAGNSKWLACRLQNGSGTGAATRAVGDWFEVKDAIFIDLTQMFGAGNEPSTVEEFKALFPKQYYEYNTGVKTNVSAVNGDPYREVNVSWNTEAGTVYGGTLDVTTGLLTVMRKTVDAGTLNWNLDTISGGVRRFSSERVSDAKASQGVNVKSNLLCSEYKTVTPVEQYNGQAPYSIIVSSTSTFLIYDPDKTALSKTEFKSAVSGVQIVYELATPVTYQLTPTEVKTLLGQNNIWADTGDSIVEYRIDPNSAPVRRGIGTASAVVVNATTPNVASGSGAFAGGSKNDNVDYPTTASGNNSIAYGLSARATGAASAAFGQKTLASGGLSFAAGDESQATNWYDTALGKNTTASGGGSFAVGNNAQAQAAASAAIGNYVVATGRAATALGSYNVADDNPVDTSHGSGARKYLLTVGNGTADNARSNALTVDWDGNLEVAGDIKTNSGSIADAYVTDAAAGSIASFADGADNIPVKDLTIDIDPVQNLNGYDNPWPAGGGKNLLNPKRNTTTTNGVTITIVKDQFDNILYYVFNGTASANVYYDFNVIGSTIQDVVLTEGTQYIFSGLPSAGSSSTYRLRIGNSQGTSGSISGDIDGITFTYSSDTVLFGLRIESGYTCSNLVVKPMIRLASNPDATFAPYANICPISGWTGAKIERTGRNFLKNLFVSRTSHNVTFTANSDGSVTVSGAPDQDTTIYAPSTGLATMMANGAYVLKAGNYVMKGFGASSNIYTWLQTFQMDGTAKSAYQTSNGSDKYITLSEDMYVFPRIYVKYAFDGTETTVFPAIYAQTDAPASWEPCTGTTIPISWNTEAGTVYGGTLDVTTGLLTITHSLLTLNTANMNNASSSNDEVPGWTNSGIKALIGSGVNTEFINQKMNIGTYYSANTNGSNDIVFLRTARYNKTQSEWIALAMDVQILVELATPVTYQLTPTEVKTLLGQNNIWADTGNSTVDYRADTKKYINKMIAAAVAAL